MKTGKIDLCIYTGSDYAGSLIDCKSTTGYCKMSGGNFVTWRSKVLSVSQAWRQNFEPCLAA